MKNDNEFESNSDEDSNPRGFPPKECKCGCREFKQVNIYRDDYWIVEYSLECAVCGNKVGTWAYGNWDI